MRVPQIEVKMKIQKLLLLLIFLLTSVTVFTQKRASTGVKRAPAKKAAAVKRVPPYQLNLKIVDGPKLVVSVVSPDRKDEIDPLALGSLITDLPTGGDRFNTPNNVFPKVLVEASPNITMLDLWNPITLFRRGRTEISVLFPGDTILIVPWTDESVDVKPNPLLLMVTIDKDDRVKLNGEPAGTVSDRKPLIERLVGLFKQRQVNGVFHEGTTLTETAVTIALPMSDRKVSDLVVIADAVKKAGSNWIYLIMDDPSVNRRIELEPPRVGLGELK